MESWIEALTQSVLEACNIKGEADKASASEVAHDIASEIAPRVVNGKFVCMYIDMYNVFRNRNDRVRRKTVAQACDATAQSMGMTTLNSAPKDQAKYKLTLQLANRLWGSVSLEQRVSASKQIGKRFRIDGGDDFIVDMEDLFSLKYDPVRDDPEQKPRMKRKRQSVDIEDDREQDASMAIKFCSDEIKRVYEVMEKMKSTFTSIIESMDQEIRSLKKREAVRSSEAHS